MSNRSEVYARPSRGVVDEVIAALDQISGLTRALRNGGPAPEDLQELSDALTEATNMAHEAMHALQAALPAVPDDTEWREAFVEVSASRYRDAGMKIEAARIHAEVDANQLEIIWRAKKAATPAHDQPEGSDND